MQAGDVFVWKSEFVTFIRMVDRPKTDGLSPEDIEQICKFAWVRRLDGQVMVVRLDELSKAD